MGKSFFTITDPECWRVLLTAERIQKITYASPAEPEREVTSGLRK